MFGNVPTRLLGHTRAMDAISLSFYYKRTFHKKNHLEVITISSNSGAILTAIPYLQDGFAGFYKGMYPNLLKVGG